MNTLLKTSIKFISTFALVLGMSGVANAGTTYYVYQKDGGSTCDISTKDPSKYNRGSKYKMVASDSTRSGAKKKGESAGCGSF